MKRFGIYATTSFKSEYKIFLGCILMKKLTTVYKKWQLNRAKYESGKPRKKKTIRRKRHIVSAWFGDALEDVVSENEPIIPPKNISLTENTEHTIDFFENMRRQYTTLDHSKDLSQIKFVVNSRKKGLRRIGGYVDFTKIEKIGTSAALILTAEYDRVATILKQVPPTINLHLWNEGVFKILFEIGFFEFVGLQKEVSERYITDGKVKTVKIMSGVNANGISSIYDAIVNLSKYIDDDDPISDEVKLLLTNALSEAMINVSKHAYPDDYNFPIRHVSKWWATGSANCETRELRVVIFDQGASIPVTYPRKTLSQSARDFLLSALRRDSSFDFENDGAYIECAMMPGKSQTNQVNRGLGLPEMKDLIDVCGNGSLKIFSRGGECTYRSGHGMVRLSRPSSIGGTLIEWTLKFPAKKVDSNSD